jgi:hypothetical protein
MLLTSSSLMMALDLESGRRWYGEDWRSLGLRRLRPVRLGCLICRLGKEQGRMSWHGNCWLRWRTVLQDFRSNSTCKMYMIPNLREHGQVRMQSMTRDCEEPQKYSSLPSVRVASSPHIASLGLSEICLWVPISASTATLASALCLSLRTAPAANVRRPLFAARHAL